MTNGIAVIVHEYGNYIRGICNGTSSHQSLRIASGLEDEEAVYEFELHYPNKLIYTMEPKGGVSINSLPFDEIEAVAKNVSEEFHLKHPTDHPKYPAMSECIAIQKKVEKVRRMAERFDMMGCGIRY